jgi:hypothetical protein
MKTIPIGELLLTVHLLKVRDLIEIADVDDGKVLDTVGDTFTMSTKARDHRRGILTVEYFVLSHAIRIPITAEADDDQSLILRHDCLVDVPAGDEMREYDGTHDVCFRGSLVVVAGCGVVGCG